MTLTGLGERVHLAGLEVDLETYVTDVVNLLKFEDLRGVVLVGHSYGGLVVTGATDEIPGRVSRLVYLDTTPLPNGGALIDKFPPELREHAEEQVNEQGDGWRFPVPTREELAEMASLKGLDEDHPALLYSRATPQPFAIYTQPLRLRDPARETLRKLGIACSFSPERMRQMVAGGRPPVDDLPALEWRFVGLPTGHDPMLSRPDDLMELLLGTSGRS